MKKPTWDEADRLAALDRYAILDTPREAEFDDVVRLAADIFDAPISVVNLIASSRQWFKAEVGIGADELPLDVSICAHAILQSGIFVVPDTTKDARFDCNPLVTGDPGLRFYAGALLETPEGLPLGTVCVLDTKARPAGITARQRLALEVLARQVMTQLELRQSVADRDRRAEQLEIEIARARVADQALLDSEERLRLAVENAEIGFWDVDVVNSLLIWPPRTKAMFGISPEVPVTMQDFYDGLFPDDREATSAMYAAAADPARRALYDVEYRTVGKEDGVVRWVAAKGRGLFDEAGRCLRVIGTAIDITDRKLVQRKLQSSEARLLRLNEGLEEEVIQRSSERALLWQKSPDLLSVIDLATGTFDRVNPAWALTLGWVGDDIDGMHFSKFLHPDDVDSSRIAFEKVLAGDPVLRFENRYRTTTGDWRWMSWVAMPDGGKLYSTTRDITADKEREAELEAAQEALRQAQKMEAVGQLTGGLAHDFNNLLTGMMGNLELLQGRVAQGRLDSLDRFVFAAQGAGRRAASLTQRLLAFSRRQTLDPKPANVNRLVGGMEDLLRRTVGPGNTIEVVGAAGLWAVNIDAGQLENALLNLSINARDAMPDGGRITIETANRWLDERGARERDVPPGQYVALCVTDSGTGMSAQTIARAFEPFFTTKPIGQGTGLGLSMIYGFARQSGGQVRIYSELGKGTTVCIYLPRYFGGASEVEFETIAQKVENAVGQTVLVIDDEATIRDLIEEVLGDLNYTVLGAADGIAGLKVIESGARIDLLITDVGLPNGLNGRQVADAARAIRPGMKVLFITGYAENAAVGNGHLEPGMEMLTKPFTLQALSIKVSEILALRS